MQKKTQIGIFYFIKTVISVLINYPKRVSPVDYNLNLKMKSIHITPILKKAEKIIKTSVFF